MFAYNRKSNEIDNRNAIFIAVSCEVYISMCEGYTSARSSQKNDTDERLESWKFGVKLWRPYLASGPTAAPVQKGATAVFLRLRPIPPVYVAFPKKGWERRYIGHVWLLDPSLKQQDLKLVKISVVQQIRFSVP
jgi:hypothetical protein